MTGGNVDGDERLLTDDSWGPSGWRTRAAQQLAWLSLGIAALLVALAFFQGAPDAPIYAALSLFLVASAFLPARYGRAKAALTIAAWASESLTLSIGFGFFGPAAPLTMCIYASMLAVFFSRDGLIAAVILTFLIVATVWLVRFGLGIPRDGTIETLLMDPENPANVARASIVILSFVILLAAAISYVVRQQKDALQLLKNETRDRIAAERAYQETQKTKLVAQITSGLAHNFGNTLMVILTWTELIKRNPNDPDFLRRGMADVATASGQAAAIARQIMVVGKSYVRNPEQVSVREELKQQIAIASTLLPNSVRIHESFEGAPSIKIDRSELQQGLLNVLLNARDAVALKGNINVRLWTDKDTVCLSVRDDGVGMSPETASRVFEPFFTTKGVNGTGLGLATLKQSVEAAGGVIEIASTPGDGTTVTIKFPQVVTPAVAKESGEFQTADAAAAARILVVDDDPMVRDVIATALRIFGYDVIEASDISDGIAKARDTTAIQMLLTDAVMPGGRLTDLLQVFEARHPQSPVMVCSGYMRDELGVQFIQDRDIHFVQKPVGLDDLRERVRRMLSASGKNKNV